MKQYLVSILAILMIFATACAAPSNITPSPSSQAATKPASSQPATSSLLPASLAEKGNFRFLISDEKNAIDDFKNLFVTISSIGIHQGNASENVSDNASDNGSGWIEFTPAITMVDLKQLIGENAAPLWSGNITPGSYNKVFIYISDVSGILASVTDNKTTDVKLPGGKLQISKPFVVSENVSTSFVFDVTVVAAGNENKNVKYILKPQADMSGAGQKYKEVKAEPAKGKPDAKPDLRLSLDGKAQPGAQVTLLVLTGKSVVEGVLVTMNGIDVGKTNTAGQLVLTLPDSPGEVVIKAISGNTTAELRLDLKKKGKD